ncbi:amidase [Corynebacterium sp. 3HC-13]|uniref:amidase n=1 Tax=Corynebacterium poyangense TaxID=2684405 RepID=UPI001CCD5B61|nr:amidase [Corynebacterium poyangense]MBZ8176683.1 amidase [Corynebacterium poyangense]
MPCARDAVEEFIAALAALEPQEHGFSYIAADQARWRADYLDALPASRRGPLHGLLIPIKDLSDVAGMPTTLGSAERSYQAQRTNPLVERLEAAGAIIPGKSVAAELGMTGYTEPVGQPTPDNPLLAGCTPGGSSGGAAVAVARGLVPVAHGSDGGGSLRIPAAACGLSTIKPERRHPGAGLATAGFLGTDLRFLAALSGIRQDPRRLKVGLMLTPLWTPDAPVSAPARTAVTYAAHQLANKGHEIVEIPYLAGVNVPQLFHAFRTIFSTSLQQVPRTPQESAIVSWLRECGRKAGENHRRETLELLHAVSGPQGSIAQALEVDLLLSPMLTYPPPPHHHFSDRDPEENFWEQTRWSPWASLFNLTGMSAIYQPWGATPGVGVHLGAIRCRPGAVYHAALELEEYAHDWDT